MNLIYHSTFFVWRSQSSKILSQKKQNIRPILYYYIKLLPCKWQEINWNFCVERRDPTSILYNLTTDDVRLLSQRSIASILLPVIWPEQKRKKEVVISSMAWHLLVSTIDLINLCELSSIYGNYVTMDWTLSLSHLLSEGAAGVLNILWS